jgi:hypothetical protein
MGIGDMLKQGAKDLAQSDEAKALAEKAAGKAKEGIENLVSGNKEAGQQQMAEAQEAAKQAGAANIGSGGVLPGGNSGADEEEAASATADSSESNG